MGRYVSWGANSLLFVLCCYLVANTANEVFAALLTPRADAGVVATPPPPPPSRSWRDREVILTRNLFNASMLEPEAPVVEIPVEEDLEETELPLTLLGTAAVIPPENSWAAVADKSINQTVVVGVNHAINAAVVKRIERKRLVLSEKGVLKELVLKEDAPRTLAPQARNIPDRALSPRQRRRVAARQRAAQRRAAQVERRALQRAEAKAAAVDRREGAPSTRNPAELLAQGRMQPKYAEEGMVGLEVHQVEPGSVLEEIGIQEGDVITQLNGVAIEEGRDPSEMLQALQSEGGFTVDVERADGSNETLNFELDE
jgi:general secretion pathway protein C